MGKNQKKVIYSSITSHHPDQRYIPGIDLLSLHHPDQRYISPNFRGYRSTVSVLIARASFLSPSGHHGLL